MELSKSEQLAYDFICSYKLSHDGLSPSYREIMRHCKLGSTSSVMHILHSLVNKGEILLNQNTSRGIMVRAGKYTIEREI